jgi:hypothetical protein
MLDPPSFDASSRIASRLQGEGYRHKKIGDVSQSSMGNNTAGKVFCGWNSDATPSGSDTKQKGPEKYPGPLSSHENEMSFYLFV